MSFQNLRFALRTSPYPNILKAIYKENLHSGSLVYPLLHISSYDTLACLNSQ